jgi:hypothetical protein
MSDLDNEVERGDTLGVEVVMRKFLSLAVMCSLAFPAMAFAQPEAPKEAADDKEAEYGEETPEPGTSTEEEMPEPPKTAADDMGREYAGEEPEGARPFLDGLSWQIMASSFYRIGGYLDEGVRPGAYNVLDYPYTQYNGFGLNFAGGMASYTGENFGVTVDLRWGTGASLLTPLVPLKQGYVSWLPGDKVAIDVGFFDTIFGAEVADEWENANYTRGALYFLRQPFNHMGMRSAFELSEKVGFTLMVTNGGVLGGTPIDGNATPTIGWQFGFAPGDAVGLFIGGNHGAPADGDSGILAPGNNRDWEQFFDVVLSVNVDWFTLLFNGDYQLSPTLAGASGKTFVYGNSLAFIFDASDKISIGLRGEHLSGNEDYRNLGDDPYGYLTTGTITVRYKPVEYLVLSLEGRGEWTSRATYYSRTAAAITDPATGDILGYDPNRKNNYAVILGASAHIGN